MKILWVKSDFLHPATKGGQIRTLETLKRLHRRHEIHYVALDLAQQAGGVERSSEYCTKAYPIPHSAPDRSTPAFWLQLAAGFFSRLPLTVSRYQSEAMRSQIDNSVASSARPSQRAARAQISVMLHQSHDARRRRHKKPAMCGGLASLPTAIWYAVGVISLREAVFGELHPHLNFRLR